MKKPMIEVGNYYAFRLVGQGEVAGKVLEVTKENWVRLLTDEKELTIYVVNLAQVMIFGSIDKKELDAKRAKKKSSNEDVRAVLSKIFK